MNDIFKVFISMSLSGSLLILALLVLRHFLKSKISRQWQYYMADSYCTAAAAFCTGHKPAGKYFSDCRSGDRSDESCTAAPAGAGRPAG